MSLENNVKDLKKVISECNLKPKRNCIMITLNQSNPIDSELELIADNDSLLDEYQYVIAAGEGALYKPGAKVLLDITALTKRIPDPNDRMAYLDMIDIKPVIQGDHTFTIISDNYILAEYIEPEIVDLKA